MNNQIPNKNTISTLIANEGCVLRAYKDSGGIWTIGYGTTIYPNGTRVKVGDVCTPSMALDYLISAMTSVGNQINLLNFKLNQNQFDALVDLIYNIGIGRFKTTVLYQYIQKNPNNPDIKDVFESTCIHDALGHTLAGLQQRRIKEAILYFS